MKIQDYLDSLKEDQLVVIYNEKHNIEWVGRAGWYPLYIRGDLRNTCTNGQEIIINGIVDGDTNEYENRIDY